MANEYDEAVKLATEALSPAAFYWRIRDLDSATKTLARAVLAMAERPTTRTSQEMAQAFAVLSRVTKKIAALEARVAELEAEQRADELVIAELRARRTVQEERADVVAYSLWGETRWYSASTIRAGIERGEHVGAAGKEAETA